MRASATVPVGRSGNSHRPVTDLANVHRDVRVVGRRRDGERVPLPARDVGHVEVEPLASLVAERRLDEAELERALRVQEDVEQERAATAADLPSKRVSDTEAC